MNKKYKSTKVLNEMFEVYNFNSNIVFKWKDNKIVRHCKICQEDINCCDMYSWNTSNVRNFLTNPKNIYCNKCNKEKCTRYELNKIIDNTCNYYLLKECTNNCMKFNDINDLKLFGINENMAMDMIHNHIVYNGYLLYRDKKRIGDFIDE